jgi:hypothetical protein
MRTIAPVSLERRTGPFAGACGLAVAANSTIGSAVTKLRIVSRAGSPFAQLKYSEFGGVDRERGQ